MSSLLRLSLRDFRNFQSADLVPHPDLNLFLGSNGAGKTNLLEAIFLCGVGKSFRHAPFRELGRITSGGFLVQAETEHEQLRDDLSIRGTGAVREFQLNGNRLTSSGDLLGRSRMVCFSPEDLDLAKGAPSERRRYLNMLLSQSDNNYFSVLCRYNRSLLQRNALLKSGNPDKMQLRVLSESLISLGSVLRHERALLIGTLAPETEKHMQSISGGQESLTLKLTPDNAAAHDHAEARLEKELRQVESREIMAGHTLFGPHLDDLRISLNGLDSRHYASRGQLRSIAVALKLAAADYLTPEGSSGIVVLLDDIFSELDPGRSQNLFALFGRHQVFAALPREPGFEPGRPFRQWQVTAGTLAEAN